MLSIPPATVPAAQCGAGNATPVGTEGEIEIEACAELGEDGRLFVEAHLQARGTTPSAWSSCTLLVTMWMDDSPAGEALPIDCTVQAQSNGELHVRIAFSEYPRQRRYRATVTWFGVYGDEQVGADGMAQSPAITTS